MTDIRALTDANRAGKGVGLPCYCTANGHVIRAILAYVARTGRTAVIEATCNQVNQEGGYTGMTPHDFMAWVSGMASKAGVPMDRLLMGGDHLGPNPWRSGPADRAMEKARELVRLYVEAGFTKIHIDTSMKLGLETPPDFQTIAARAADLCAVAEAHAPDPARLIYVIGTEVPIPGGETDEPEALDVTSSERLDRTVLTHRDAFADRGLDAAWGRIVSVVTQPGVDFGHSSVYPFDPARAAPLSQAILSHPGLTLEAHSTDYQPTQALRALTRSHFLFLKVGPELTFRFREAVFALAAIEDVAAPPVPSRLREVVADVMDTHDVHWRDYYRGPDDAVARLRTYSYSDRIRYYWSDPEVAAAVDRLMANLSRDRPSETVVSQHYSGLEFGDIPTDPARLVERHVLRCVERYDRAASGLS